MSENVLAAFFNALSKGAIRVIDLTQPLDGDTPTIQLPPEFGKTWPFRLEEISRYDSRGPAWYWNNFACGEHTGTHFDAPIHWVSGKDYASNATHDIPSPNSSRLGVSSTLPVRLQRIPTFFSRSSTSRHGRKSRDASRRAPGS